MINTEVLTTLDDMLSPKENVKTSESTARTQELPSCYSLDGLNLKSKIPLKKIVDAVRNFHAGKRIPDIDKPRLTILLSGVPGGGKTAFVNYLAKETGARLKTFRASDLLSKWVGENEKNLASAFRIAKEENAILFLDEVDSFLQNRSGLTHPWEVSGVNELLQQMENFTGVMIAATNFSDNLDKAAMRRFTFKIELDYLTNEGKRIFFSRYFTTPLSAEEASRLDAIDNLAPGDYRTVKEELFYVCDEETNDMRLEALEAESQAKTGHKAKIGF